MPDTSSRRDFVKSAALAGFAAAPAVRTGWAQGSPSKTVNIAVVGFRGRGRDHYREYAAMPNVRVAYLCDIDERLFPDAVAEVEKIAGYKPQTIVDFRELIQKKDVDAVSIATPDHWHGLQTIWACQAGKDVYVEKPASHTLLEGRKMIQAARKYDRIVQVGLNTRSEARDRSGVHFVHQGSFGKPYRAKAIIYRGRVDIGTRQESSIPKGVHWDLFLGPAPYTAFNLNRFHYAWHYYWETATAEVGNNGVHALDVVRWAMQLKRHPVRIHCTGGYYGEKPSDQQVPNVQVGSFEFEDGTLVEIDSTTLPSPTFGGVHMGTFYYTPNGYITSAKRWSTMVGTFTPNDRPDPESGLSLRAVNLSFPDIAYEAGPAIPDVELAGKDVSHFANFIDCVRSRKRENLRVEVEEGVMSTSLCHLANISFRTGRKLVFDPDTWSFPGDEEANALATKKYREPFTLPDEV